jgi:predicted nucleic acid-binding protein
MKYVIDSSVAFKWVVPETDSDKAPQLRADYENASKSESRIASNPKLEYRNPKQIRSTKSETPD